jgi:hypothetical protein
VSTRADREHPPEYVELDRLLRRHGHDRALRVELTVERHQQARQGPFRAADRK